MTEINTGGAEQALIDKLKAKNKQLKSTLAESVSLVADQHVKIEKLEDIEIQLKAERKVAWEYFQRIEQLESDLSGCIKLIAKYESERNE